VSDIARCNADTALTELSRIVIALSNPAALRSLSSDERSQLFAKMRRLIDIYEVGTAPEGAPLAPSVEPVEPKA
jgi:hypothetical protein